MTAAPLAAEGITRRNNSFFLELAGRAVRLRAFVSLALEGVWLLYARPGRGGHFHVIFLSCDEGPAAGGGRRRGGL